jgi:hypothetical protein
MLSNLLLIRDKPTGARSMSEEDEKKKIGLIISILGIFLIYLGKILGWWDNVEIVEWFP